MTNRLGTFASLLLAATLTGPLPAQGPPAGAETEDPADVAGGAALRVRQQRVGQMMAALRQKFRALADRLQQTEPERAERLVKTLHEAEKLLLQERMTETADLLADSRFDLAADEQAAILSDVKRLVEMLLAEEDDPETEVARLQDWKERLETLAKEQKAERREAALAADPEAALDDLDARIEALEAVIADQKALLDRTTEAVRSPLTPLVPLAGPQGAIRDRTEALGSPAAAPDGGAKPATDGQANDTPAPETPSSDAPASDTPAPTPPAAGGTPSPGAPSAGPPSPGDSSGSPPPGGSPSGDAPPSAGPPSDASPSATPESTAPPRAGDAKLKSAVERQRAAEDELITGRGLKAERSEQQALADLEAALGEMKAERVRIARLPPETVPQLAKRQKRLAERAAELGKEMQESAGGEGAGAGAGQPGGAGSKPGQKALGQAGEHMDQAAEDLGGEKPESALRQEDEAVRKIEEAIREIEKRLAQLRKETREERLARLEARFRAMLDRQREVSGETRALATATDLTRKDRLTLTKLAADERSLSAEAAAAYDILVEDGTSLVFPQIVATLRGDLDEVAGRLGERRLDGGTTTLQADIETTLTELIAALQKLQREAKQGGGGGGGGGQPNLLPGSAELKLLKSLQLRINRRTEAIHDRVAADGAALSDADAAQLRDLAATQQEIAVMTEGVIRNLPVPPPEDAPPPE